MTDQLQPIGSVIDIIDDRSPDDRTGANSTPVPHRVFLDGKEVYVPRGARVETRLDGAGESIAAVTITMFARRVRLGYADELTGPAGRLPANPGQPIGD
jgi:hypothetical protein